MAEATAGHEMFMADHFGLRKKKKKKTNVAQGCNYKTLIQNTSEIIIALYSP